MWIKRIAPGFLVLLVSFSAVAKKEVVFFGGGGEPKGDSTIFDAAYNNFAMFSSGGWQARSYFNGGHAKSEAVAQKLFKGKNQPMTTKNMADEIANLKARIEKGDLKSGDQVMITIATHGLEKNKSQASHSIATTDSSFNLDEIAKLRDLAEKKGVSLAIVDFSCYSGNTLSLGTDKTCVISTAADTVAYNTSGDYMGRNFTPGRSLESAFLDGRSEMNAVVPAAPQISTEAGRKAYQLTKILSESMSERSTIRASKDAGLNCYGVNSVPYRKLQSNLRDIGSGDIYGYLKVKLGMQKSTLEPLINKLQTAVKKYEDKRKGMQKMLDEMQSLNQNACHEVQGVKLCGNVQNWEFGYKLLSEKEQKGQLDEKGRAELAVYKTAMNTPQFKRYQNLRTSFSKQESLFPEAKDVARVEREVYNALYGEFSKKSSKPNPCRKFTL
ncbi:hypothetical protein [Bdellovibrio sp. HCB-162]|uniref:hypothetical protein n=1 Tax=Bdellovibrio sp. HCB-162 TaxID=3394234 RepID=UPI0039BCE32E